MAKAYAKGQRQPSLPSGPSSSPRQAVPKNWASLGGTVETVLELFDEKMSWNDLNLS